MTYYFVRHVSLHREPVVVVSVGTTDVIVFSASAVRAHCFAYRARVTRYILIIIVRVATEIVVFSYSTVTP